MSDEAVPKGAAHIIDVRLGEWLLFEEGENGRWAPNRYPDLASTLDEDDFAFMFAEIKDKWLYIVQAIPSGHAGQYNPRFYAEVYVDKQGMISVNSRERVLPYGLDNRPAPVALNRNTLPLPAFLNNTPTYFVMYCSRIRLAKSLFTPLAKMMTEVQFLEPGLKVDTTRPPFSYGLVKTKTGLVAGVVEPLTVALKFAERYRSNHNDLMQYTQTWDDQNPNARKAVEKRHFKLAIADILNEIVHSDPADNLKLREILSSEYYQYRKGVRKAIEVLIHDTRVSCVPLCKWMETDFWRDLVTASYEVDREKDLAKFVQVYGECFQRLTSCDPGRLYLYKVLDDENSFFNRYIGPAGPVGDDVFQAMRKSFFGFLSIWSEGAEFLAGTHEEKALKSLVKGLEFAFREPILTWKAFRVDRNIRKEFGYTQLNTVYEIVELDSHFTELRLGGLIKDGTDVTKAMTHLGFVVEVVNLGLSIYALNNAKGTADTAWAAASVAGSVLDLFSASKTLLSVWTQIPKRTLMKVAAISAIIDMVSGFKDLLSMLDRNDYSAAVGYGLVIAGNAVIFVGLTCCLMGWIGGPTLPIFEVTGAILIAAGWLIATFTKDNDLQLFARYCCFGDSDPRTVSYEEKWSGKVSAWYENYELQLASLINLASGFELVTAVNPHVDRVVLRIIYGLTQGDSRFIVKFQTDYNLGYHCSPELAILVGQEKMEQIGGTPADLKSVWFGVVDGRACVDVWPDWAPNTRPHDAVQLFKSTCTVHLDMHGDGRATVPMSGKEVEKQVEELTHSGYINGPDVASKNF